MFYPELLWKAGKSRTFTSPPNQSEILAETLINLIGYPFGGGGGCSPGHTVSGVNVNLVLVEGWQDCTRQFGKYADMSGI